jgi:hypothetical protein
VFAFLEENVHSGSVSVSGGAVAIVADVSTDALEKVPTFESRYKVRFGASKLLSVVLNQCINVILQSCIVVNFKTNKKFDIILSFSFPCIVR